MVYTGTDEERSYKSTLDPKSDNELAKAERIAKKIKAYLDISDSYNVNSVVTEKDNGKSFIKAEVSFKSGSQVLEISFNFLDVNDKLLLVSID